MSEEIGKRTPAGDLRLRKLEASRLDLRDNLPADIHLAKVGAKPKSERGVIKEKYALLRVSIVEQVMSLWEDGYTLREIRNAYGNTTYAKIKSIILGRGL